MRLAGYVVVSETAERLGERRELGLDRMYTDLLDEVRQVRLDGRDHDRLEDRRRGSLDLRGQVPGEWKLGRLHLLDHGLGDERVGVSNAEARGAGDVGRGELAAQPQVLRTLM